MNIQKTLKAGTMVVLESTQSYNSNDLTAGQTINARSKYNVVASKYNFVAILIFMHSFYLSAQSSWQSINTVGGSTAIIQGKQIHFSVGQSVSSGTSNPSNQIQGYQYIYFNYRTATNETRPTSFHLYPNPASDIIQIINEDIENGRLEIFNMSGQRVLNIEINNSQTQVDVSNLNPGSYLFSFIQDQSIFKQNIVIQ